MADTNTDPIEAVADAILAMKRPAHDHTDCCGPDSPYAARQWLLRNGGTHSYRWRTEMNPRTGAGYVELLNGYDSRSMADAVLCERPGVNAVALRWDQNRGF